MDDSNQNTAEMQIIDLRPRPRYVMDFSGPSFNLPVPTQVCFHTGNAYAPRTKKTLALVEIIEVGVPVNFNDYWDRITITYRVLNADHGHPTGALLSEKMNVSGRKDFNYGAPPCFISAIDRWEKAPDACQAYTDVLDVFEHGFGLINSKYLDLKNEMANLNATLARLIPSADTHSSTGGDGAISR